jgi:RNA polymerase sigma-70 factor (ECF subfamily)
MPNNTQAMDIFLASVEKRAYRMAHFATGSREEALDIVQDTMFRLVRSYAKKPEKKWKPLFYKILQNRIRDWYRRRAVRNRWHAWVPRRHHGDNEKCDDPVEHAEDRNTPAPDDQVVMGDAIKAVDDAMRSLPLRQQQAFMMRGWEGLSVRETATAMKCSEGTVKAHYSRAVHTLRSILEDHRP